MVLVCVATIGIWCESNASREPSSVEVIASQASASGTAVSTKDEVATESVELTWGKKCTSVKAGSKVTLSVKNQGKPVKASKISWQVTNSQCATINGKGVLRGIRVGTVTVKAMYEKASLQCKIKIKPKQIIGIDPGHQQQGDSGLEPVGPGASAKKPKVAGGTCGVSSGCPEYKFTLRVGKKLKKELESRGYQVVMTRTKNNVSISNKERAQKINKSGADIYVRLHGDGGASSARGASGLYPSSGNPYVGNLSSKSRKLSQCIMDAYCKSTGIPNRGIVQRDDLSGTNWSKVPVSLIELGFMTNMQDDRYMQSTEGQKAMVEGIADGIDAYYK